MALENPGVNFIGIEASSAVARILYVRMQRLQVKNLKIIISEDSVAFNKQKKSGIVSEIYYIGIEAMPRHNLAFTHKEGIDSIKRLLASGGKVYLGLIAKPEHRQFHYDLINSGFEDVTETSRFPHRSDANHIMNYERVFEKPEAKISESAPAAARTDDRRSRLK